MTTMTAAQALAEATKILNGRPYSKENHARAQGFLLYAEKCAALGLAGSAARRSDPHWEALSSYIRRGEKNLSQEQRALLRGEERAMIEAGEGAFTGSTDGYFVPSQFEAQVNLFLKQYDRLFDVATVYPTARGGPWSTPVFDMTGNPATKVTETVQSTPANPNSGVVSFGSATTWRTPNLIISNEYLTDFGLNIELLLAAAFGQSVALGVGPELVSIALAAATLGRTAAGCATNTGGAETGANSIGSDDIADLVKALDPAYRGLRSGFAMNDNTATTLKALRNKQGGLVFEQEYDEDGNWLLFGKPVLVCPAMDDIGSGKKPVMFGSWSMLVRRVVPMRILRLEETYAEFFATGYVAYYRTDAAVFSVNASPLPPSPIVYLQNA